MAAMSVIGIDFGNESCYVAVAKAGGIETIANDYSLRATPSFVAFSGKNRILGVAAKAQHVTNIKNTIFGIKRLLGRKYRDPHVQRELAHLPYKVIETSNGGIGIKVNYLNEEHIFSPEQCLAMLLTKLKDVSAIALQTPINDCVISVPSYFTNNERKALLDAATIAGLNVLRLFNETTATALCYGIYKQDLPAPEEKPRNVIFVDVGHSAMQVCAVAFHKGKLRVLATSAANNIGGRDIDFILADHFAKEFLTKYKIDAKANPRAFIRIVTEVEKIKKQMSANSTTLPLNIECLMEDIDVRSEMKRADMESLCTEFFARVENTLRHCLETSGLALEEIHAVEVCGGSSRIPAIKQLIEKVFGKVPSTTLNQDESVSRGCALQCAMLSPAVRVRDFSVADVQSYPIMVSWDPSGDGENGGEVEVFPVNHAVPFSKMLTFYRQREFSVKASYSHGTPYPDQHIGTWTIKDIKPSVEGKAQKVKVKVRVNLHGIMTMSSASLMESKESPEPEPMEEQPNQPDEAGEQQPANEQQQNGEGATPEEGEKDKKKKHTVKSVELPIESLSYGFSQVELNQYTEQEFKMIAADRQEKERADARNALEEYVYELRNKLASDGDLAQFILDHDREEIVRQLDEMENWLYEEGEDCNRQVYQDRLTDLKNKGEPIQTRKVEFEVRPHLVEDLSKSVQLATKAVGLLRNNDPKYAHLTTEDVQKVEAAVEHAFNWLEATRQKLAVAPKHLPVAITTAQIRQERLNLEQTINPILNKPLPKAPSPPKDDPKEPTENKQDGQPADNQQQSTNPEENMEWSST